MSAQLSIDDLLDTTSIDEIQASIYSLCDALGLPVTSWQAGDPTRTMIAAISQAVEAVPGFVRTITASGFLDDAEGGWLTLLAKLVYGVDRVESTFASGALTVVNALGGIYDLDPGDFVVQGAVRPDGSYPTYRNTAAVHVAATSTTTADFQADEIGSGSNAGPGEVATLVTQLLGVAVTNAGAWAAEDAELDPDLRQRCRDSLGALSPNGPKDAYRYVLKTPKFTSTLADDPIYGSALGVEGGCPATRVKKLTPPGDGTITFVVADGGGAINDVAKIAALQSAIDAWATPEVVTATVEDSTNWTTSVVMDLVVDSSFGVTDADWQAAAKQAITDLVPQLPIGGVDLGSGGVLLLRMLEAAVERMRIQSGSGAGDGVVEATVTAPSADVPYAAHGGDLGVFTLADADVTVNVTQIEVAP